MRCAARPTAVGEHPLTTTPDEPLQCAEPHPDPPAWEAPWLRHPTVHTRAMRSALRLVTLLAVVLPALVLASPSIAAQPPSPNDPCVSGGQDTCGTTGVGYYRVYRYGTRWFGDYRGVVPGTSHTFCIDLRFWYPSKTDAYRELDTAAPRNRAGQAFSPRMQQE